MHISIGMIILLVGLVWGITNLNAFKSSLGELIQAKTGMSVAIPGDLQLSLFPNPGLKIKQASVNNAESFSKTAFVELGKIELSTKLLPLLLGRIELDTVRLTGLSVFLSKNKQGLANWQEIFPTNDSSKTKPLVQKILNILGGFGGEGVRLEHGFLQYENQLTQRIIELKEVNAHIANLRLGQTMPVTLNFTLHQNSPELTQIVQIYFDVELNAARNRVQIKHFQLRTETPSKPQLTIQLTIANLEYQLDKQTLSILDIHLLNGSLNVYSELQGHVQQENFELHGPIQLSELNLKQWLSEWSINLPNMQDKAALTLLSADAKLTVTQDSVQLAPLVITIDQTAFKGSLMLKHFDNPQLDFDILADKVAMERYLAPASDKVAKNATMTPEAFSAQLGVLSLPLALLKNFHSNGQLKIQQMSLNDISMQELSFELRE